MSYAADNVIYGLMNIFSEYADGQVVWSLVDGLRSDVTAQADSQAVVTSSFNGLSRHASYDSSHRGSNTPNAESDLFIQSIKRNTSGTQGLNLRSKEKPTTSAMRPETDVSIPCRESDCER